MIKNRSTYAKIKILRSLFAKKIKKPFSVIVFKTYEQKIYYDLKAIKKHFGPDANYSKRHSKNLDEYTNLSILVYSRTSNIKTKPITLTYYLDRKEK